MSKRYDSKEKRCKWDISVIDEFAALRIALDKKEFAEIVMTVKKNYTDG